MSGMSPFITAATTGYNIGNHIGGALFSDPQMGFAQTDPATQQPSPALSILQGLQQQMQAQEQQRQQAILAMLVQPPAATQMES